jgi:hypothetical protein
MRSGRRWLFLSAVCAVANAAPPPPQAPPSQAQAPQTARTAGTDTPDEGFIEFLGSDDVGDAAWWEFLKRAPPRGNDPPATTPQDAKK